MTSVESRSLKKTTPGSTSIAAAFRTIPPHTFAKRVSEVGKSILSNSPGNGRLKFQPGREHHPKHHREIVEMYVQYGCGWSAPPSWENFDASPTLIFERIPVIGRLYTRNPQRFPSNVRYGDIVRGLPISANSCSGIYCSHILEHLAASDVDVALTNTFHYLQSGKVFRLVVPDLRQLAQAYLADASSSSAHRFMKDSSLGQENRPRGIAAFAKQWLGNSVHAWMWDEASMEAKLSEHGFIKIRRAQFGDSEDQRFCEVENRDRFDGCLGMQCKKP